MGLHLWAAIDLTTREVLAVHLTTRSHFGTMMFLAKVVRTYRNRSSSTSTGSAALAGRSEIRLPASMQDGQSEVGDRVAARLPKRRAWRFHSFFPFGSSEGRSPAEWSRWSASPIGRRYVSEPSSKTLLYP